MSSPAWSPNGRSIAWLEHSTSSSVESVVWVANADGTSAHAVTQPIDAVSEVEWLSGDELAYWANYAIYRLRPGGKPRLVSSVLGTSFSVDRSANRLAVGSSVCPTCVGPVSVIPLRPGVVSAKIGPSDQQNSAPTLSPDGRSVAFTRVQCSGGTCKRFVGIWTAATSRGAAAKQLVPHGVCPAWSPRGTQVFYAWDSGYVVPASGGEPRRLPGAANCAEWSPDGRLLAAISAEGRLSVIDVRTGRRRTLPAAGSVEGLAWSPGSNALLVAGHDPSEECSGLSTVDLATGKATQIRSC
jgi:Tol biopolymer transport system component